jgi:hypothetical protein
MFLFSLLTAKVGAATAATKIAAAVTLSLASFGTAGATGLLPVADLLPSSETAVVTPADSSPAPTPVDETVNGIGDVQAPPVDDGDVEDLPVDDGDVEDPNGDDGDIEDPNGDDSDDVDVEDPNGDDDVQDINVDEDDVQDTNVDDGDDTNSDDAADAADGADGENG